MLVLAMEFSRSAPATRACTARGGRRERLRGPARLKEADGGGSAPSQRNRGGPIISVAGIQVRPEGLEPAR